jgi:hypothetical protein
MTEIETLFLRTLDDIEGRIKSPDPYEVLGMSALIRKLFLDDNPLVDQVNRTHRQKIRFTICDPNSAYTQMVLSDKPAFYSVQDGLDPNTARPGKAIVEVGRDQFFGTMVLMINAKPYSVREIILFEANVMGGVHAGSPRTDKDKALSEMDRLFRVGGSRAGLRQLQSISRVILRALQPLVADIKGAA